MVQPQHDHTRGDGKKHVFRPPGDDGGDNAGYQPWVAERGVENTVRPHYLGKNDG